jgi:hypothetical protein
MLFLQHGSDNFRVADDSPGTSRKPASVHRSPSIWSIRLRLIRHVSQVGGRWICVNAEFLRRTYSSSRIAGACRHIVRAHFWISTASAKLIGHLRTSQTLLLSRETEDVVAIKPFSAPWKWTSDQNAFTVSIPTTSLIALTLNEHERRSSFGVLVRPDSHVLTVAVPGDLGLPRPFSIFPLSTGSSQCFCAPSCNWADEENSAFRTAGKSSAPPSARMPLCTARVFDRIDNRSDTVVHELKSPFHIE